MTFQAPFTSEQLNATMSNKDLGENTSRQEADEAALLDNEMEHEDATTPTTEIQENLQNTSLGEKEKFKSELTTIAPLLDQVREY